MNKPDQVNFANAVDTGLDTYISHDFHHFIYLFLSFGLFRATLVAHGGSQARGPIRAAAADLHNSHSNARSESRLRPTPQLMAMLDP